MSASTPTSSNPAQKRKPVTAIVRDFLGRNGAPETQAQRNLLQYYASRARKEGWCNPGHDLITHDTGIGHYTIDKANAHFRTLGVLSWKKGWGNRYIGEKGKSNLYQLDLERMELLTFLSTGNLVKLALPLSLVSTATLKSSTATPESSTATLSSSTLQQVAPKVQAFEVTSVEEQARKRNSKSKSNPLSSSTQNPKSSGMANQEKPEVTRDELNTARQFANRMAMTHLAKKNSILLSQRWMPELAVLLRSYPPDGVLMSYNWYLTDRLDKVNKREENPYAIKFMANDFVETGEQSMAVYTADEAQRRREDAGFDRAAAKMKEEADARLAAALKNDEAAFDSELGI